MTINFRGRLTSLSDPMIMGILNLTPDSFSDGGQFNSESAALDQVGIMIEEGANIIDVGAFSSRPGASEISAEEELERLGRIVESLLKAYPDAIFSVDTFRASVAKGMLEAGIHMVNDISGGVLDVEMYSIVAEYDAPYVIMHMQGNPTTMQLSPAYKDVFYDVWAYFVKRIEEARKAGIIDIILDPGFGFGKTLDHNYQLFRKLGAFREFDLPLLIGISRKSMIWKLAGGGPGDVLHLTTALHLDALKQGVRILRVHDVKPAMQAVKMYQALEYGVI